MPIESIETPKAPKGWRPTSDQMQRVQQDRRLQALNRDELYAFFNQRRTPAVRRGTARAQPQQPPPAQSGGIFGWVDAITNALRGSR